MVQRLMPLLLALVLALVAGCSGAATGATQSASADVDLTTLTAVIDASTVAAIRERADVLLIDVREQAEYDAGHIPGITLIPMSEISGRLAEIPKDKTVIITCRSGNRSSQVAGYLREQGFTNIHDMQGGILAWQQAGLPVEQ